MLGFGCNRGIAAPGARESSLYDERKFNAGYRVSRIDSKDAIPIATIKGTRCVDALVHVRTQRTVGSTLCRHRACARLEHMIELLMAALVVYYYQPRLPDLQIYGGPC